MLSHLFSILQEWAKLHGFQVTYFDNETDLDTIYIQLRCVKPKRKV